MPDDKKLCPVCNYDSPTFTFIPADGTPRDIISCLRCGDYEMSATLQSTIQNYSTKLHLLAGLLRNQKELGASRPKLNEYNIETVLASITAPSALEKIEHLILYLGRKSENKFGSQVPIDPHRDYPITYSVDHKEYEEIKNHLETTNIFKSYSAPDGWTKAKLSYEGWKRYYELQRKTIDSTQCFVAMNFDKSYESTYLKIAEAIEECGYKPYCVQTIQSTDVITDLIIGGIRKSKFMVADFSGERPSVYFEAGFAKALGREVIWTIKKGDKIHFDTQQYSHIIWENIEELKARLKEKIEAVIV